MRAAIQMALDVPAIVEATFGDWASVPVGPVPELSWIRDPSVKPPTQNTTGALALFKARGWFDTDGDGYLDKNGKPLALSISFPSSSAPRAQIALLAQEQLRHVGVKIELNRLEGSVWNERRNLGNFDIDFGQATLDPSPHGLVQSWGCAGRGGSNVAYYCDPKVDSLLGCGADQQEERPLAVSPGGAHHRGGRARGLPLFADAPVHGLAPHPSRRGEPDLSLLGALAMEPGPPPLT